MSDKPIAPCHFCGKPCKVEVLGWKNCKYFVRCGTQDDGMFIIGCGYGGPIVDSREEAIAKHTAICSSIPRAQIEALEAEMRERAEQFIKRPVDITIGRGLGLNMCADRLSSLLHPELKEAGKRNGYKLKRVSIRVLKP